MIDHNEMNAIASLYAGAKNIIASDEFRTGFSAGFHLGEILHEERIYGDKEKSKNEQIERIEELDKGQVIARLEKRKAYLRSKMYTMNEEADK